MCGTPFDRLVTRYLCPSCRIKTVSCCDGDPLPPIPGADQCPTP